nr:protein Wnt-4-like [Leptinotarsa decemlineata]
MRIFSKINFVKVVLIFSVYCSIESSGDGEITEKKPSKSTKSKKSFVAVLFSKNNTVFNATDNKRGLCRWLRGMKHQNKLCSKKEGLAELLIDTRKLTIDSCKFHFRYEHWPCLYQKKYFRKVYRETALMYSLTTSAFMYLVAKACASGKLENCKCASHGKSTNSTEWEWGGCGDNTKFAKKFTYKFLRLRKKGDVTQRILRYNSEVGMKVVMKNEEKVCKCHGLSGSCSFKICFKRVRSFSQITKELVNHYHSAIKVDPDNDNYELELKKHDKHLIYLEEGSSFCPSTMGRQCKDADNCATLCCGRGFFSSTHKVKEKCNCRWRNESTYEIECEQCEREDVIYTCH